MKIEDFLNRSEKFRDCDGKVLCSLIGGSTLYGLDTPESDIDYRGIFTYTNKRYLAGLDKIESVVTTDPDASFYEIGRYIQLLRKTNTQVLEILFSPNEAFVSKTDVFDHIRANKYRLIDSDMLISSLKGYVFSEIRLATGERSGQLGSKRKNAVKTYGFSPKNFVQILRLCKVGQVFYNTGEYMVKVKDYDPSYHDFLMDIKMNPEKYSCEQLKKLVDDAFLSLTKAMDDTKISFKFDENFAADVIMDARNYSDFDVSVGHGMVGCDSCGKSSKDYISEN